VSASPSHLETLAGSAAALLGTWRGRFIVAWIVVQAALPLLYYATRRDPHDERFAWRMFSPTRMIQCDPQFTLDDQKLELGGTFHEAWIDIAARGRFSVVEAMGARLCHDHPGKRIDLTLTCKQLDGGVERWGGYDVCSVPDL
jgi:hypothetical protein